MSWEDPPTDAQEKAIGLACRILSRDTENYYPISTQREAGHILRDLWEDIRIRNARRAAQRISKKIVDRREK